MSRQLPNTNPLNTPSDSLERLLDSSADWIWSVDLDGIHTFSNTAVENLLGFAPAEIVGQPAFQFMHPEDCADIHREFCAAVATKRGWQGLDVRWVHKNGSIRFFQSNSHPILDESGELQGFCGIDRDVTEERRIKAELVGYRQDLEQLAEKRTGELRDSEARYRGIVENIPMLICRFASKDGIITYVNQAYADYFRIPINQLIGSSFFALIPESDHDYVKQHFANLTAEHPTTEPYQHVVNSPDGRTRTHRWIDHALFDATGKITEYQSIGEDITDYQVLEERLRQAQKIQALGTLAGGIAHEFNNILCAMQGYTELALVQLEDETPAKRQIGYIGELCDRATGVVRQILQFSRMDRTNLQAVDLRDVVQQTLELLRATIPADIEIVADLQAEVAQVKADPIQIQQALVNLVNNAWHAIEPEVGTITVSLFRQESEFQIVVSDTGSGIARDLLGKVFDPFFTTKDVGKGTGLGLSVVHGIVDMHRGEVTIRSEVGVGTTVTITLPVTQERTVLEGVVRSPAIARGQGNLLVVEDDESVASMYREFLTSLGYNVTSCSDGRKALTAFRDNPSRVDLVFTDMAMSVMNGKELVRELLTQRPDLPIILATGYSAKLSEQEALAIGVRRFMLKPVRLAQLAAQIEACLQGG